MALTFAAPQSAGRGLTCGALAFLLLVAYPPGAIAQEAASGSPSWTSSDEQPPTIASPRRGGLLEEPSIFVKSLDLGLRIVGESGGAGRNGFYPEFSNMITGSGMVSAGPGYRYSILNGKGFIDMSAAVSWHLYKMAQGRVEFPELADGHLAVGAQTMFQDNTQVSYFGRGNDAVSDNQTQYRLQTTDITGYLTARPTRWLSFGGELGWLERPNVMATAGTFNPGHPDARVMFPNDPGMNADYQPNFLRTELSVAANTLDSRSHPTTGTLVRGAVSTYVDRSAGTFGFSQYEAEGVQMVPLGTRRVLLGLHAWTMFTDLPDGHQVPFYLMPSIGGNNTLRGYDDYQFHEQNSLVATAELRLALLARMDLAAFYDAGSVAARYGDLRFEKTDFGGGLRLHTGTATFARIDVAHGSEGWRLVMRTTEPFKLSRVTRKLASAPFVP